MGQSSPLQITPAPSEEEAAALAVALSAFFAATRTTQPAPLPSTPLWAIAGRLASQGRTLGYRHGVRPSWAKNSRGSWS
jgi:hypothetical protein